MVTAPPHPSVAVTELSSAAGTPLAQLTVVSAGKALITGPVSSSTGTEWHSLEPQSPEHLAWQLRVVKKPFEQLPAAITSASSLIVPAPPHPSVAVTDL